MDDKVYKLIELTGSSPVGIEDAVNVALARAGKTIKHLRWFQIIETRGDIDGNRVRRWQVTIKVGFTIEDPAVAGRTPGTGGGGDHVPAVGFRVSEVEVPLAETTATDAMTWAGNFP